MAKGWSLHVGLNSVDPGHYGGWSGDLKACEADAHSMEAIARQAGCEKITRLLTRDGTRARVTAGIEEAAAGLAAGDFFFLTYSGHGGQLPDTNGDELDALDETWCLYDGQLVDDELHALLAKLAEGVRVLVLSDSCHSGTVTKFGPGETAPATPPPGAPAARAMPKEVALRTYMQNRAFYDPIIEALHPEMWSKVKATVRLISGCQDNQLSRDGQWNGAFTATLLEVWNGGRFRKSYYEFAKAIRRRMPSDQQPNDSVLGPRIASYDLERPFTI